VEESSAERESTRHADKKRLLTPSIAFDKSETLWDQQVTVSTLGPKRLTDFVTYDAEEMWSVASPNSE